MAGGNMHFSKWVEDKWLRFLIGGQPLLGDDEYIFTQVWNAEISPSASGFRVFRALLCTACSPNDPSGTNYTELAAGSGYPDSSNLNNMPHVRFGVQTSPYRAVNIAPISFGPATANWSAVNYLVIVGQRYLYPYYLHSRKIWFWYQFNPAITITSGQSFVIPAGSLTLQVT